MGANREDFYHGSRAPGLDVGDTLLPHNKVGDGRPNYPNFAAHSRDRVFMSNIGEHSGWMWANLGGKKNQGERAWVARVEPVNPVDHGGEVTASSAKIVEKHDIKPGHQGTFNLNWNQFSTMGHLPDDAFNHPTDQEIELGHKGAAMSDVPPDPFAERKQQMQADREREEVERGQGRLF